VAGVFEVCRQLFGADDLIVLRKNRCPSVATS